MLGDHIRYHDGVLYCEDVAVEQISAQIGTPTYIYSKAQILDNYTRITDAFSEISAHIHYSVKANNNPYILNLLIHAGAGMDAVSSGEIFLALNAGCLPENIVFAGVGKTIEELRYAIENGIGWINVENVAEIDHINRITGELDHPPTRIALRLNPQVTANTHPYIATGHGGAKFGLTASTIADLLTQQAHYKNVNFAGIHVHIGSQLNDTIATKQAIQSALKLIEPYPGIRTIDIGGGLPTAYTSNDQMPSIESFVSDITPFLTDYQVIVEPGRAIVADAGILLTRILYVKEQAGQTFYIVDASMSELIRPALYQTHHEIIPITFAESTTAKASNVVGPVCETADVLGRDVKLPPQQAGDLLAILTTGAYGMVMASNYNARLRPPEILIDRQTIRTIRPRETLENLIIG